MKLHKRLANLLIATMVLTSVPVATMASDYENHWASNAIEKWTNKSVIQGFEDGTFRPNEEITNAQFAKIVVELMGYNTTDGSSKFVDVAEDKWYTDYITKISAAKVMHESSSEFNPNKGITREAAAYALVNAYKLEDTDAEKASFADEDAISDWAVDSVKTLYNAGYIQGNPDGTFNPQGTLTRAELITMIDRMNSDVVNVKGVYSQNITGNLVVNTTDVVLKDMTIEGDLYLAEGIGEGEVELENVIVNGRVIVEGGGVNSIKADRKCKFNKPLFAYAKNPVHIVINGDKVDVYVGVDTTVYLTGKFAEVNAGPGSQIIIDDATVDTIVAEEPGKAPIIDIKSNSVVDKVEADVRVTIQGNGRLGDLEANVDGVSSAIKPGKTSGSSKPSTPSTSGKNSWNSGFNDYDHKPSTPTPGIVDPDPVKKVVPVTVEVIGDDELDAIKTAVKEAVEGLYQQEDGTLGTTTTPDKDTISNKVKETLGTELGYNVDVKLTETGYKITITLTEVVEVVDNVEVNVIDENDVLAEALESRMIEAVKLNYFDEETGHYIATTEPEEEDIELALGQFFANAVEAGDLTEDEVPDYEVNVVTTVAQTMSFYRIDITLSEQQEKVTTPVAVTFENFEDSVKSDDYDNLVNRFVESGKLELSEDGGYLLNVEGYSSIADEGAVDKAIDVAQKLAKTVISGLELDEEVEPTVEFNEENSTLIVTFAAKEAPEAPAEPVEIQALVKLNKSRLTNKETIEKNLKIVEKDKGIPVEVKFDDLANLVDFTLDNNKTYVFTYVNGDTPTMGKPVIKYEFEAKPSKLTKEQDKYVVLDFNDNENAKKADIAVKVQYAINNTTTETVKEDDEVTIKINDIVVEEFNDEGAAILKDVKIGENGPTVAELVAVFEDESKNNETITYTLSKDDKVKYSTKLADLKEDVFKGTGSTANTITFTKATISAITGSLRIDDKKVTDDIASNLTLTLPEEATTKFESAKVNSDSTFTIKNVELDLSKSSEKFSGTLDYTDTKALGSDKPVTKTLKVVPSIEVSIKADPLKASVDKIDITSSDDNVAQSNFYGTLTALTTTTSGAIHFTATTTPKVVSANISIIKDGYEVGGSIDVDDKGKFVTKDSYKSFDGYKVKVNSVTIEVAGDGTEQNPTRTYTSIPNNDDMSSSLGALQSFGMNVQVGAAKELPTKEIEEKFDMKVIVDKLNK